METKDFILPGLIILLICFYSGYYITNFVYKNIPLLVNQHTKIIESKNITNYCLDRDGSLYYVKNPQMLIDYQRSLK